MLCTRGLLKNFDGYPVTKRKLIRCSHKSGLMKKIFVVLMILPGIGGFAQQNAISSGSDTSSINTKSFAETISIRYIG
jgi:hypothetical protein